MNSSNTKALILFAHGARDPDWAGPMKAVREQLLNQQSGQPNIRVELAFLEQMQPTLQECVESLIQDGIENIAIYPMFIATGTHLKKDLPALVEAVSHSHPRLKLSLLPAAGEQLAVQQAITRQALEYLN